MPTSFSPIARPAFPASFTLPIPPRYRQRAEQQRQWLAQLQSAAVAHQPHWGDRAYRNALAGLIGRDFLRVLGFECSGGGAFDPLVQAMGDVADVQVVGLGRLECRALAVNETVVRVPPETWDDRWAYLAIALNPAATEAEILGFVPSVGVETLDLALWRSPYDLAEFGDRRRAWLASAQMSVAKLGEWLGDWQQNAHEKLNGAINSTINGAIAAGWEPIESLFARHAPALCGVRSRPQGLGDQTRWGKILWLEPETATESLAKVALSIQVRHYAGADLAVQVQLQALQPEDLPNGLQVMICDHSSEQSPVLQARATNTNQVSFDFGATVGEQFSVGIALEDLYLREAVWL